MSAPIDPGDWQPVNGDQITDRNGDTWTFYGGDDWPSEVWQRANDADDGGPMLRVTSLLTDEFGPLTAK